jgi:hypothetical protein
MVGVEMAGGEPERWVERRERWEKAVDLRSGRRRISAGSSVAKRWMEKGVEGSGKTEP